MQFPKLQITLEIEVVCKFSNFGQIIDYLKYKMVAKILMSSANILITIQIWIKFYYTNQLVL